VIWIAVALIVLLFGMIICVAIFAALGFGQMKKDIGFKLPTFNLFTGRWSDEDKERDGNPPEARHTVDRPAIRRRRKLVRSIYIGYVVLLLAGFILGYLLAGGSEGRRLVTGCVGVLVAMLVVTAAATILRVGISVRMAMRERKK
jgi:hypothetical protein